MPLSAADIDAICGLVMDLCGVYLDESKAYLIESRLGAISRNANCQSYAELARKARYTTDRKLQSEIVDAITTHETLFFRDNGPFEALKHKIIPDMINGKEHSLFPKKIRIWSAACSTGQEPYSIAMTLHELLPDIETWDIKILATDVSDDSVKKASQGWYSSHEIERGMTPAKLKTYFTQENDGWRVRPEIRSLVQFERRNLLESFRGLGPFDIVLCRNVAIYFTLPARSDLFLRMCEVMTPNGYLLVGCQESLTDIHPRFVPQMHCRGVFYQPNIPAPISPVSYLR